MSVLYALLVCLPALTFAQPFDLRPYNESAAAAFSHVDLNNDGVFDRNELDTAFKDADTNHDGTITFHEYSSKIQGLNHDPHTNHLMHALFEVYDAHNNHHLDHHDYDLLFSLADSNNDNVLQKTEFVHYVAIIFETAESV